MVIAILFLALSMITPKSIHEFDSFQLMGMQKQMSLASDETPTLFKSFMPIRKELKPDDEWIYEVLEYPAFYFSAFNPTTPFTKWAAVKVPQSYQKHEAMTELKLPAGLYAEFLHKGPAASFPNTMQTIFSEWLPQSKYELDQRPHFNRLPQYYNPKDPSSEEHIFIPVREKA